MKLDLTKKVQTRDGRPVEIKFTDGRGDYKITGYVDDAKLTDCWTIDGKYDKRDGKESGWDLINVPEWHLPDPPHGYEWHRTDWTEEMLPEGWRPLLLGEITPSGDEFLNPYTGKWVKIEYSHSETGEKDAYCRTRRPLPPPKPQLREVELCADDIKAGDEFLAPDGSRYQWTHILARSIGFDAIARTYEALLREGWKIRSSGETEWRKCSKQEEVPA